MVNEYKLMSSGFRLYSLTVSKRDFIGSITLTEALCNLKQLQLNVCSIVMQSNGGGMNIDGLTRSK